MFSGKISQSDLFDVSVCKLYSDSFELAKLWSDKIQAESMEFLVHHTTVHRQSTVY